MQRENIVIIEKRKKSTIYISSIFSKSNALLDTKGSVRKNDYFNSSQLKTTKFKTNTIDGIKQWVAI